MKGRDTASEHPTHGPMPSPSGPPSHPHARPAHRWALNCSPASRATSHLQATHCPLVEALPSRGTGPFLCPALEPAGLSVSQAPNLGTEQGSPPGLPNAHSHLLISLKLLCGNPLDSGGPQDPSGPSPQETRHLGIQAWGVGQGTWVVSPRTLRHTPIPNPALPGKAWLLQEEAFPRACVRG